MQPARPLLLALLLSLAALSGCVSGEDTDPVAATEQVDDCVNESVCGSEAIVDETGRDLRTELTADDVLQAPTWKIGDVFEQHVYYGSRDTSGTHIKTMVVDDGGSCYQFGTTDADAASYEAAFEFFPFLGCIDKDLTTTAFEEDWSWMYDFPLEDGKTWTGGWNFMYNWNSNTFLSNTFTLTASYEAKINTPSGDFPGFIIVGLTDDGEEILRYNYVPAVGWFSHFWLYDITTPDDGDVVIHMMSMGRSDGYTGPYYVDEGNEVFEGFSAAAFAASDPSTGNPTRQFTVPDEATYLRGNVVPFACGGRAELFLTDPTNSATQFTHEDEGDPARCAGGFDDSANDGPDSTMFTVYDHNEAAIPGTYTIAGTGAPIGGWYVRLVAITEGQYELTADMLPMDDEADAAS